MPANVIISNVNPRKKEKLPGIFLLTDKRIIFYYGVVLKEAVHIFDLAEVKSVQCSGDGGLGIAGHIEIYTMTKSLDILVGYKKKVLQEMVDIINRTVYEYRYPVQKTESGNDISQIEKLYELCQKGIITQEEFQIKKRQLLGM